MTKVVQLTINPGGVFLSHQQIYGEIVSEGRTEKGEDYIVFRDAESEEPHRIYKRKITNITDARTNTTIEPGS